MNEETQVKDKFWLYVGGTVITLLVVIAHGQTKRERKICAYQTANGRGDGPDEYPCIELNLTAIIFMTRRCFYLAATSDFD